MAQILIESDALDSLKRMVEELEQQRNSVIGALMAIYKAGTVNNFDERLTNTEMAKIAKCALDFYASMKHE